MTGISNREALDLMGAEGTEFYDLMHRAGRLRSEHDDRGISLCAILNAKSGHCPQDCVFCAQSSHNQATIETYPLMSADRMVAAADRARRDGARHFSIVTSGKAVTAESEVAAIAAAIRRISDMESLSACASLGILSVEVLTRLRDAGLHRFHHNLETAESFFPNICTTSAYADRVRTIEAAKSIGLSVCAGGLFGMGESRQQRVELLATLRDLEVDSVPINFLNPIPGTKLEHMDDLSPMEALRIIAVARLMMPDREIRIAGGRMRNLRDLHSWIFLAGANGLMIGDYLTTTGRRVDDDLTLLADQGLYPVGRSPDGPQEPN
ncbi:MAG: biotin synthase BioB [Deltaproteobacteria bacterium]|nr:biotin synthase BioB [Deltaproteobacteria bacterium]